VGKGVNLTGGAQLTERRGRGGRLGKAQSERENVFPVKTRSTRGLDGPAGTVLTYGDGAAGGLAGPEAERAARLAGLKAMKHGFSIKNWIFEFTKALEICRRRFRRNFDMRIFPKFF
jgi:hypothetical protein